MNATVQKEPRSAEAAKPVRQFAIPEVNIFETQDGCVLQAEMPGVSKDGLNVTLEGQSLTLVGHRNHDTPEGELIFRESHHADYMRVFELDPSIDTGKIAARMDQGVLTLHLPKTEAVKPRKIAVAD